MRRARTLKLLLAGANLLLAAGIAVFGAAFLFVRPAGDLELPVPTWETPGQAPPPEDRCLTAVRNPISPATLPAPPGLELVLLGTLPNRDHAAAFLRSGKEEFVAFVGESVGPWRLEEVDRDRATFTDGRARREIPLQESKPRKRPAGQ